MSLNTGTSVHRFSESDTSSNITDGAEALNRTAPQSHSQSSIKPFGSRAARFRIRSFQERENVDDSSQKSNPSKELNKVCTSASYTHTNTDDKETGNTLNKNNSTLPISSEISGASAELLNTQEDMSQTASDRSRDELGRLYQSNKSKSLQSRAGHGNTTVMPSGTRDYGHFMRRSNSSEKTETNSDITSTTQDNQPSCRTYNAAYEGDHYSDKKLSPVSGCTSLGMNRVNFALERARSGQSLPSRLKPRHSLGSVGEGSSLWEQQPAESSLGQADKRVPGSWIKEQGPCNAEEVTGYQTIKDRINKLFGAHGKSEEHLIDSNRLKRSNTLGSDVSFPNDMDTVDSTPSHRKNTTDSVFGTSTDSQQEKPSYNTEKSGTFPRRFSKTYFGPKQEPLINHENRNEQRDNSSGLSSSLSSKTKWSTEMSSVKTPQSRLPDNNKETSKSSFSGFPKYNSQSLERTRSRQQATAQYSTYRNQSANSDRNSTIPGEDLNNLLTLSREIKEKTEKDKQSDKETTKRLDIKETRCFGGSQDEITQPTNLLSLKGAAHREVQKDEKDDVFTLKPEGRKGEGVLEKFRAPSLDSVKNTISMFESLAQQSKGTAKSLHTKRTLSVPEHPKPPPLVKKSDSERNLHYGRVEGNTESPRPNFIINKEIQGTLSKAPNSNSDVKVRPTVGRQETYKNLVPEFKQINESGTDQVSSKTDDAVNMTAGKKHREPDSGITVRSGLRNIGATEEKAGIPPITQQSNTKSLLKQQTIHVKLDDDDDDDDEENTPTNSPNSAPSTIVIKSNTEAITVNGTHSKVLPNLSHSSTPLKKIYSSLNHSNNNNYKTSQDLTTPTPTSKARWSSDEEDYDEETDSEEDSDSGESSVTITSKRSQSDRRSFSLSFVDLCNFGGVDYKSSDDSLLEDDKELPSSRSASISSDISVFSSVTLLSTDELDRLLDDVRSLGDDTLKKYEDVQVVVLHKEVGSGLGFTLAGGVDQNKPVTVHKIIPGGVAHLEGSIFEGARVLSINGTALQNSAHWEALRTLRKAKGQGMAVVVLQSGNSRKEATEKPGITGKRVRLTLNKSSFDLGFSLEGGVGSSSGDKPLTVQKIFRGGPVSEVFPGDELLEVQGQSLEGMMRLEAWNLIKKLPPGPVEVLLHRPQQPS